MLKAPVVPNVDLDSKDFWEGVKAHTLLIEQCAECLELRHPPRPMCPHCNSLERQVIEASGKGTLYSVVSPDHPRYPMFHYPYLVALVELEEGVRLVSNLCEATLEDARIGMPVEVTYEEFDEGVVLPKFRPAESNSKAG